MVPGPVLLALVQFGTDLARTYSTHFHTWWTVLFVIQVMHLIFCCIK